MEVGSTVQSQILLFACITWVAFIVVDLRFRV